MIKAFGLENRAISRFRLANQDYYKQMSRFIKYESLATPVSEVIISFGIAAVIYFGGIAQLTLLTGSIGRAVQAGIAPFALLDLVKAFVAASISGPRRRTANK